MPMKTYTNTTNTTTKKSNKSSDSSSSSSKNHCPCFTCKGKPQPTWQDLGDKRWYCKSCWDEYEAEEVVGEKKEKKKNPAAASRNVRRQAPKKDKKKNEKDKPAPAEKKQSPKKKEKKVKTSEKKKKPTAEKPVPAKRREEELAWESLEELAREASRMRDLTSLSKKKKPSSVIVPTPDSTNTINTETESKTSDTTPLWCHPDIAKTREQICVNKNWMAHSKKAMYRSALESVAQAAKDLYTPPPAPPAPPVATTTTTISTTTSGPVPDDNNTATTTNDSNKKQKKNKKRNSKSKSGTSQYVPFPVESLAFLPSLVHAVESPKGASAPEVESLLKSFLEKAWDQEIIQKEKQAVGEVMKKLREEQAAKLKEKIARKEAAEKEAAAARALAQTESTPAKNDNDAELPPAAETPAEPVNTAPAEGEQPVVATVNAEKKKKSKKPKMPKITEHMINRALPSEIQQARSQRLSFMNQLQTYVRIITRTGVSLSVGITALYIVYSKCSSHDLYALLIRFQEHFQRCAPAQNQAVSYVVNLAGSIVVNNNISTASSSSSSSTTTASVESPHDSLLRAKEKLQAIFEEYMDDHKERAIKSAIVEPSEFIGYCSGDSSAADHVEANGRWVYLTAVVEGLGGGSDRVKEGTSEFQLPLPVLQGEDQYQIGTHFAWDAIREDEAAAFKDPLHFGMSGFRNVKLLKDRVAPAEEERRAKKQCRDYRYQSDKGGIGNLREMFQVEKPESEYDQELKLWAKNIDAFAYFFSKDFFIKRCFETLNTESRPEYAGFRTACFTVFKHYLLATSAAATSEDATCTDELMKKQEETTESSLSIEDQLYEYCYSDEYCTELNVDNVFKFFQWLGIAKQEKSEIPPAEMNQEEGDCKCGLECYLDELAAKEEKMRLEQEQQQQVEVGKEEEEEGYGETKQQRRQDELDGRRRRNQNRVSKFQKNKYQSEPEQSTNTTVQTKKQEEEVAPPPMLIDDGFAMSKTKSFEIEPEPPLFVCSP